MRRLVVFTEEMSAKVFLVSLLPRLLPPEISFHCHAFEGKQDLNKQLPIKLRGWRTPNTSLIVLQDQDSADCHIIKSNLRSICTAANKPGVLIRIACRELESWYFGDLAAVEVCLKVSGLSALQRKAQYRIPDSIVNPAKKLKKVTKDRYQKVSGSRIIGKHLSLDNNLSASYQNFISGVRSITDFKDD